MSKYNMIGHVLALTTWLALLGSVGSAQVKWSLLQPSSLTDADGAQILDLATGQGIETPAEVIERKVTRTVFSLSAGSLDGRPLSGDPAAVCASAEVRSSYQRTGQSRTWRTIRLDASPCGSTIDGQPAPRQWKPQGGVETFTQWLIEDAQLQAWVNLLEYWAGTGRIAYQEAERVVRAFMRGSVLDRRAARSQQAERPELPLGRRATQIESVSRPGPGWQVWANGSSFDVVSKGGQFQVVDSSMPIP